MLFALDADTESADIILIDAVERYRRDALPGAGYLGVGAAEFVWDDLDPAERRSINDRIAGLGYPRSYPDGTDAGRFLFFVGECVYGRPVAFPERQPLMGAETR